MTTDIVALARRHKHIASHYEGCEADHVGCLVHRLADEVEGLRAENERLHKTLYRIAGKVPFADDPWTIARNALKGKP